MTVEEMWDKLIEMGVSEDALRVATYIEGYTQEAMEDVLYTLFGYRSFDQLED